MNAVVRALLTVLLLVLFAAPAYGAVSSGDLLENPRAYAGETITFEGEAIGDVMRRGENGWVNVHDGENAIGIWAPVALLDQIRATGGYKHTGDTVRVRGVFSRGCEEHRGDIDIHAESLEVVSRGEERAHPISPTKAAAAGALSLLAGGLYLLHRSYRSRFSRE